jgi:hypothetical protein
LLDHLISVHIFLDFLTDSSSCSYSDYSCCKNCNLDFSSSSSAGFLVADLSVEVASAKEILNSYRIEAASVAVVSVISSKHGVGHKHHLLLRLDLHTGLFLVVTGICCLVDRAEVDLLGMLEVVVVGLILPVQESAKMRDGEAQC